MKRINNRVHTKFNITIDGQQFLEIDRQYQELVVELDKLGASTEQKDLAIKALLTANGIPMRTALNCLQTKD